MSCNKIQNKCTSHGRMYGGHQWGCVTAAHFIFFNFANYLSSIAMELKVSKEITDK